MSIKLLADGLGILTNPPIFSKELKCNCAVIALTLGPVVTKRVEADPT